MNRKKIFSCFIVIIICTIGANAQNTGPNSIDAVCLPGSKNMVNPLTGDFSYALPVMEVPGPAGNYSIVLKYKAGITTDQEASWVGMGWGYIPGAINRTVNGVPDDWKEKRLQYIVKGDEHTVDVGYGSGSYMSAGMQFLLGSTNAIHNFKKRTFKNHEQSIKVASGTMYMENGRHTLSGIPGNCEQSRDSYMDTYSFTANEEDNRLDDNTENENLNNNLLFPNYDKYMVCAGSFTGTITPRIFERATITGESKSLELNETTGIETDIVSFHYRSDSVFQRSGLNIQFSFDKTNESYLRIKPGSFDNSGGDPVSQYFSKGQVECYSIPEKHQDRYNNTTGCKLAGSYPFVERKGGGNHIEWFKNSDLAAPSGNTLNRGFIETESITEERNDPDYFDPDGIGAFTITTIDGTSYHYSLPVYQYEIFFHDEHASGSTFFEKRMYDKYAYTWLLTAITGPDFIDNPDGGNYGTIGTEDNGYWVKFNYGKWTDGYIWRSPYENSFTYNIGDDLNDEIHNFYYMGRKQIYYLNTIETASHTAYFIKDIRNDGKGKNMDLDQGFNDNIIGALGPQQLAESGWTDNACGIDWSSVQHNKYLVSNSKIRTKIEYSEQHPLLKLEQIVLVKNEDATISSNSSTGLSTITSGTVLFEDEYTVSPLNAPFPDYTSSSCGETVVKTIRKTIKSESFNTKYENQIIDVNDIAGSNLISNSLTSVDLIYDDINPIMKNDGIQNSTNGKLTLKEVKVTGIGGVDKVPSHQFTYYNKTNAGITKWGYCNSNPDNWSLATILSPYNGKTIITYEEDQYAFLMYGDINNVSYMNDGGIRVSKIGINDNEGNTYETEYSYLRLNEENSTYVCSGALCYKPGRDDIDCPMPYDIPGSMVLYSNTKETSKDALGNILSSTEYEFEVYNNHEHKVSSEDNVIEGDNNEAYNPQIEEEIIYESFSYNNTPGLVIENVPVEYNCYTDPGHPNITCNYDSYSTHPNMRIFKRKSLIHDFTASIGRIKKVITKNKIGNILSSTEYIYWPLDSLSGGICQESYQYKKRRKYYDGAIEKEDWYLNFSSRVMYPSVTRFTISSSDGVSSMTEYLTFDLNTGSPIEIKTGSGRTLITPAYKILNASENPLYATMGPKYENILNKNMLVQSAATYNFDNDTNIININIQTWQNNWHEREFSLNNGVWQFRDKSTPFYVWKRSKNFSWNGKSKKSGLYDIDIHHLSTDDRDFDWTKTDAQNQSKGWQIDKEITRYSGLSGILESKNVNDQFVSMKYNNFNQPVASATNTNYCSFTHCGFEYKSTVSGNIIYEAEVFDDEGSSIQINSSTEAHTGNYFIKIPDGTNGPKFRMDRNLTDPIAGMNNGRYIASVWLNNFDDTEEIVLQAVAQNGQIYKKKLRYTDYQTNNNIIEVEGWILINLEFIVSDNSGDYINVYLTSTSGDVYIDDFRVHPIGASINSFVYDENGFKIAELNNNNFATFYEYDEQGQVKSVSIETIEYGIKKVKEYDYHYAREN